MRRPLPVRVGLMLWGVGVLGGILLTLGIVVRLTVRHYLMDSVDSELAARAVRFTRPARAVRFGHFMGPGGPGGPMGRMPPPEGAGPPPEGGAIPLSASGGVLPLLVPNVMTGIGIGGRPPGFMFRGQEKDDPYFPRWFDRRGNSRPAFDDYEPWDRAALAQAAAVGDPVKSTVWYKGEPLRIYTVPCRRENGGIDEVIQIPMRLADIERGLAAVDRTLLMMLPLALMATVAGGVLLTYRAVRPIEEALDQERRFVADASHELRTPIAIIRAAADIGLEAGTENGAAQQRALERIGTAAERSRRIVEDLLLLARAGEGEQAEGRLALQMEPIPALELLAEATQLFAPVKEERLLSVDAVPPDLRLLGDRHHLGRVLSNLIDNAVRHTAADGRILLAARRVSGGLVEIAVTDNGEGISPEHLPHLFRRFYRADAGRTRARGGAGLGLSIARAIVEAHSGSINVESTVGKGTQVRLLLPAAKNLA